MHTCAEIHSRTVLGRTVRFLGRPTVTVCLRIQHLMLTLMYVTDP